MPHLLHICAGGMESADFFYGGGYRIVSVCFVIWFGLNLISYYFLNCILFVQHKLHSSIGYQLSMVHVVSFVHLVGYLRCGLFLCFGRNFT